MELKFVNAKSPDFAMLAQKLDDYYFEVVGAVQNICQLMVCLFVKPGNTQSSGNFKVRIFLNREPLHTGSAGPNFCFCIHVGFFRNDRHEFVTANAENI